MPEFQPADSDIGGKTADVEAIASKSRFVNSPAFAGRLSFPDYGQFTRDDLEKIKTQPFIRRLGSGWQKRD
ncbi:hypothetical protein [Coleofasciculus sp. FACHB-129]|uniref:hypothetical protein n=1 Tax=Cyanophyceae TaxID=3028117 RepID=UPI001687CD6A|nr:hypothetical protein [Coleofasciculus sp. FACHB-129]MBD1895392.1 hypothetical protein [Coleofasciculus sp. FACHB-129]